LMIATRSNLLPDPRIDPVTAICYVMRSEEHTSELQSRGHLVCRLLLEKKNLSVEVDGEKLIIAKERLSQVMGERPYKVLEERKGQDLEGVSYVPPLLEETHQKTGGTLHRVFLSSEYVTMTDGTGLVHMAPGHGEEDFEVGQRNGLP